MNSKTKLISQIALISVAILIVSLGSVAIVYKTSDSKENKSFKDLTPSSVKSSYENVKGCEEKTMLEYYSKYGIEERKLDKNAAILYCEYDYRADYKITYAGNYFLFDTYFIPNGYCIGDQSQSLEYALETTKKFDITQQEIDAVVTLQNDNTNKFSNEYVKSIALPDCEYSFDPNNTGTFSDCMTVDTTGDIVSYRVIEENSVYFTNAKSDKYLKEKNIYPYSKYEVCA